MTGAWTVVLPLKPLHRAKSRLSPATGEELRPSLALAFAEDTVAAVMGCPEVHRALVVTSDERAAARLAALGAGIVPDSPGRGLNAAVEHGVRQFRDRWDEPAVVALNADLPALRAEELALVLREAADYPRSFLADAAGTGTTLLAARGGVELAPGFGPASRTRHRASGAVELLAPGAPSVRQDVDTGEDLRAALDLGVGPATALRTHRLPESRAAEPLRRAPGTPDGGGADGDGFRTSEASHR